MIPINDDDKSDILSQDLFIYITHLEEAFNEIEESEEKTIIQEWLFLILENPRENVAAARIRNMALSELLMNIERNRLRFPFNERPCLSTYAQLVNGLMSVLNQNTTLESTDKNNDFVLNQEPRNHEMDVNDFDDIISTDNRTYVALRSLPNNGGVFGYLAVTIGNTEDSKWLNSKGCPMISPVPMDFSVKQIKVKTQVPELPPCNESDIKKVWRVLKHRRPEELRNYSFSFYKILNDNVEQEMVEFKNNPKCTHPFINKLLKFLEIDMKINGVTDLKLFCRIKMLSILKKQIQNVLNELKNRSDKIECAINAASISAVVTLPPRCCYNFVSSALWNEISQQRPGTKYMNVLSYEYPQYFFPKYFSVLVRQKQQILTSISSKYCKILDEIFDDMGNSIMTSMEKYRDAKWEWHLAHEIIDAFNKERAIKDNLCVNESSVDESVDSFFAVILNEIDMAQNRLKFMVSKNNLMIEQIPEMKNEIADREMTYKTIENQLEDKMDKYKKEINNEKRDIMKRESTIAELQRRAQEVEEG